MAAVSHADRPIEFRSATLGATVAMLRETEPPRLADALHLMLGGMPDFFSGEPAILDFAPVAEFPGRIDWPGLTSLFRRYRLQPIGVRNLPLELAAAARQAGLAILDAAALDAPPPAQGSAQGFEAPAAPPSPTPPVAARQAETLFIDRPLRSGQQIYARGGDLVLLAGVSSGSEVIADGSIHCFGPLRGRALAGAQGNTSARIISTNFGPEIVSIAGIYRTFEQGIPPAVAGRAAHVNLVAGGDEYKLFVEPLQLA